MKDELEEMKKTLEENKEFKKNIGALKANLREEIQAVLRENSNLRSENKKLTKHLEELEQYQRSNNIEIKGIPHDDNPLETVKKPSGTALTPASTGQSFDFAANIEFQRWLLATAIAVVIMVLITGLAFLVESMWGSRRDNDPEPPLRPGVDLLGAVSCNSTICKRYKGLISSCMGSGGKSPCAGLSDFVCGEGVCYGRPMESLLRGLLRALAADELAAWRPRSSAQPSAVDNAAALYEECRERTSREVDLTSSRDNVDADELQSLTDSKDTAGELAARLAARYQDGAFFWLDAVPIHGETKRRVQLKVNKQFLLNAETREASSRKRKRRSLLHGSEESPSRSNVGRNILRAMDHVHMLWKKAGNLRVYEPKLMDVKELDKCGLSSAVLVKELSQVGNTTYNEGDKIEVANTALLPFLTGLLQTENIKEYLAWEFLRHRLACTSPTHLEEKTLTNGCFDCIERVAGLAAHAPFLRSSREVESQAKQITFLQHVRDFMGTSVREAKWLPAKQRAQMIDRLQRVKFVRGIPAGVSGMKKLNNYYSYLPKSTGSFAKDYKAATQAAWSRSLTRTEVSSPLLSAFPNVLTRNNVVYIPAVALVPPLFNYGDVESVNYSFLGVALMRAVLHSLGMTGMQSLPDPEDVETAGHIDILSQCLQLNRSAKFYSSRLADVMGIGAALRALELQQDGQYAIDDQQRLLLVDSCLFMCTADDPRRCDMPAGQAAQFQEAFTCPRATSISEVAKCTVW
ncbi:hypothetical protein V5799_014508 [Amblyomma americanum]|uniref:M13 family peptidase n=1 Tax=Amblyomma americanum TaxID=6943 RepID=A0AAQ4E2U3_AMBAM